MMINRKAYALAAIKANEEGKILHVENGAFVFEEPPVVVEEEGEEEIKERMDDGLGVSV